MIIGMDFGTTNSGVAVYDGNHLQLIPIDTAKQNNSVARTALYLTNDREVYIGRNAIDTYYEQNLNRPVRIERVRVGEITLTFAELPSFIRDVYIDKDVLSPGRLFVSFKTALSSLSYLGTVVGSHFYFLEDIIALYLYIAKQRAEAHLGQEIKRIALGRPVHFSFDPEGDQLAKERLLKAAFRAGYDEVYLQYEPIAAAYHYESTIDREQNVLIFDFGGGTLDMSVLRVGNPQNREVLATGGVPIAGDIFDQKLVRAKLPKHFGEGSFYRAGNKTLSVPNSFYEAFSNWQDMLALQRPIFFEDVQRIEQTADKPRQIRALKNLISSSYGLKMFDEVEAAKRQLSTSDRTSIQLNGPNFQVHEPVTRTEFEKIIQAETRTIEANLDMVIRDAGLKPGQIDAVIRTGGSSQIPAFVEILERRFGREKVRSIDIFSSVTSGLGIIAHRIERGEIEAHVDRKADYNLEDRVADAPKNEAQPVNFEMMKKFIAFTETQTDDTPAIGLVAQTDDRKLIASVHSPEVFETDDEAISLEKLSFTPGNIEWMMNSAPDQPLLLSTSDYRFVLKTPRQLAHLNELGLELADAEGFATDVFGNEYVSGVSVWERNVAAKSGILLSTSGHFRTFRWEGLVSRIEQPVPYQVPRLKGYPVTVFGMGEGDDVIAFTSLGRAIRMKSSALTDSEGRVMMVSTKDQIIAALSIEKPTHFLLGIANGSIVRLSSVDIPLAKDLRTSGSKVITAHNLKSVIPWRDGQPVWVVTTQRLLPVEMDDENPRVKLKKGETLVSLLSPSVL